MTFRILLLSVTSMSKNEIEICIQDSIEEVILNKKFCVIHHI